DEFTIDITEAVAFFRNRTEYAERFAGEVPLSIRTDNSRDLEMIPSDMGDHNLYGGIHRYLNLVYVPSLSVDKVFATATVDARGREASLQVDMRWYNPASVEEAKVELNLRDPKGKVVKKFDKDLQVAAEDQNIWNLELRRPAL